MEDSNNGNEIEATQIPWDGGHVITAGGLGFMAGVGLGVIATLLTVGGCENKKHNSPKIDPISQTIKN